MMKEKLNGFRTWIEIDRSAIKHNIKLFRGLFSKKTKLMAVVKSNAYGHGLIDFSREMERFGADWVGVDSIVEGLTLRREGITLPILVLGFTLPELIEEAILNDISITVTSLKQLEAISKIKKTTKSARIHIKVDTGMHRQGFLAKDLPKILGKLKVKSGKLQVEGLCTHFASAKNPAFPEYTKRQLKEFEEWRRSFKSVGFNFISHAAATAGALLFPESHYDMVRIGIGLYGLWPSKESRGYLEDKIRLEPALSWKTVISEIKKLPKGSKIGYDSTETLAKDSLVAVCPIGYWHGYPRSLSSIAHVLVRGKRARILGRVSMDMISIDVSTTPGVRPGDEVVLIGSSGNETVSAYELGNLSDSSWYEIVTRLNPLIKRIYR